MNKENLRYIAYRKDNRPIRTNRGLCSTTVGAAKTHATSMGSDSYVVEYLLVPTGRVWSKEEKKWIESQITLE